MQFDDALKQLNLARTAASELETEFGARPQFGVIGDTLRNFESVLKEAIAPEMVPDDVPVDDGFTTKPIVVDTGDELAIPASDIIDEAEGMGGETSHTHKASTRKRR